jgi:hypothetical protein
MQPPPLILIMAAPDPEFLAGGQGIGEAGPVHRTAGADGFSLLDFCGGFPG